jgi:hypothetical protein
MFEEGYYFSSHLYKQKKNYKWMDSWKAIEGK